MTKPKKSLGQHFLSDRNIIDRIIRSVCPKSNDLILEIGPGRGALTERLAAESGFLLAIEADRELAQSLGAQIGSERIKIVHGDALEVDLGQLIDAAVKELCERRPEISGEVRVRAVANLPYYISTPILQRLIGLRSRIFDMTLMLQDEVVDRITSGPGSREYGYLSVLCQFYCEVEKLFEVAPGAFYPPPEVRSAVVRLRVRPRPLIAVADEARFLLLVRSAFAQRRKTILNNLKAAGAVLFGRRGPGRSFNRNEPEAALREAGIDPRRRAETLSIAEFAALYRSMYGSDEDQTP